MSELTTIHETRSPITREILLRDLQALGVREGDLLLTHTSLSAIGWVCGRELTVIRGLLDCLGETGTLVVPTQTGDNSDPAQWENPPVPEDWFETIRGEMPPFDPDLTPCRGMGAVPECLRRWSGALRSNHPQGSFAALGAQSQAVTTRHVLSPQFGMETPLGYLYEHGGRVLLLGVDYTSCTCFHLAEVLAGGMPRAQNGAAILQGGRREWVWYEDIAWDTDDFQRIGEALEGEPGIVVKGQVGNATCRLFDLRSAVDFACRWMRRNRVRRFPTDPV